LCRAAAGPWGEAIRIGMGRDVLHYKRELVRELAAPKPGDKVQDIGSGTGIFALKLKKYQTGITGIDVPKKMLGLARSTGRMRAKHTGC